MLEFTNVEKWFGKRCVLSLPHLELKPGQIYALVGGNGAGKTVFLKILSGVYSPTRGKTALCGRDYHPLSPRDAITSGVAYVPQIPYLPSYFSLDALHTLTGLTIRSNSEFKFKNVTRCTQLKEISLVDRQLLEYRLALAREPRVLLIDEPQFVHLEGFDAVWGEIVQYCRSSDAIVIVSRHDVENAITHSDAVLAFEQGRLSQYMDSDIPPEKKRQNLSKTLAALSFMPRVHPLADEFPRRMSCICVSGAELKVQSPGISCIYGAFSKNWHNDIESIIHQLSALPEFQRNLAVVPNHWQDRGLALNCSIEDNLVLSRLEWPTLATLFGRRRRRSIRTALLQVLSEFSIKPADLDEKVGNLSGGNKQRLAVARALLQRPRCIVAVNPWRGLDPKGIADISSKLTAFSMNGGTLVVLTDDVDEAAYFRTADRFWSLNGDAQVAGQLSPYRRVGLEDATNSRTPESN